MVRICSLILIGMFVTLLVQHGYRYIPKKGDTKEQVILFDVPHHALTMRERLYVSMKCPEVHEFVIIPIGSTAVLVSRSNKSS